MDSPQFTPLPGGHNRGNALGLELYHLTSAWKAVRHRTAKRFIPVYRLGEDGDLLKEGGAHAFGLGVKSLLL